MSNVVTIPDGKIRDYVDGTFRNDTAEEYVRQTIERRLVDEHRYPSAQIAIEFVLQNGSKRPRADIVVFDKNAEHVQAAVKIIVECKQPEVPISQKVCDQACRYNSVLQVPYLLLTNGKQLAVIAIDYAAHALRSLPSLPCYGEKC